MSCEGLCIFCYCIKLKAETSLDKIVAGKKKIRWVEPDNDTTDKSYSK